MLNAGRPSIQISGGTVSAKKRCADPRASAAEPVERRVLGIGRFAPPRAM